MQENIKEQGGMIQPESKEFSEDGFRKEIDNLYEALQHKYKLNDLDPYTNERWLKKELYNFLHDMAQRYGNLEQLRGKHILDLGSGATYERDIDYLNCWPGVERLYEPWLARALAEIGAEPVAIDIGRFENEPFEAHTIDLSKKGALDFLPSKSFDVIYSKRFLTSPQLMPRISDKKTNEEFYRELKKQIKRLLKDDGYVFEDAESLLRE